MKLVELHARAMELAVEVVDAVRVDRLDRSTPCAGWTLRAWLLLRVAAGGFFCLGFLFFLG